MFYQKALTKFWLASRVDSLLTIGDRPKLARAKKVSKFTSVYTVPFHGDAYFCMSAYKHDVVVVIKMVPIFLEYVFSMGAYYPDFMV